MKWKKLLLIGDSNVQLGYSKEGNWAGLISDLVQRKCDVINRGFSGYNTNYIKLMLPELLDEFEPESVCGIIFLIGSNDSTQEHSVQHVSLEKYRENLEWILSYLTNEWGFLKEKIIFISPPRIDDFKWKNYTDKMNYEKNHFDSLVTNYAAECVVFTQQHKLLCVDLNQLMHEQGDRYKQFLCDGLHLSTLGAQFLFDNLKSLIENNLINNISFQYPYWKDLDPHNPNLKQF